MRMYLTMPLSREQRWAMVRLTFGFVQMFGAVFALTLILWTGVTVLSLGAVVATGLATGTSLVLFRCRPENKSDLRSPSGPPEEKMPNEGPRQSPKSDSMRNHQRWYRRVRFVVILLIGLGTCVSCRSDRQSDTFLEGHSQELVDLTVPIDSSSIVRSGVQRTTWAEKVSWEFDTKMSRAEYTDWVNGKLKDRFRVASTADSQLSYWRSLGNDTESITVHLVSSGDHLHVRVEAGISPD